MIKWTNNFENWINTKHVFEENAFEDVGVMYFSKFHVHVQVPKGLGQHEVHEGLFKLWINILTTGVHDV